MYIRTKADFQTALRAKTSIWPGDQVRYEIKGIYVWRPGDSALEKIEGGGKYLFTNPGNMSIDQMQHIALQIAELIGLLMGISPIISNHSEEGTSYQLGERH